MRKTLIFLILFLPTLCFSQWVTLNSPTFKEIAYSGTALYAVEENNGVYFSTTNGNTWIQTSLTSPGFIKIAAYGNNVFAGTSKGAVQGIYRSTNSGVNWVHVLAPVELFGITAITIDGNNIYASTGHNIYRSTNNGTNWVKSEHDFYVYSFAVSGTNIFAGVEATGVYLSTNSGMTWKQTSLNNVNTLAVTITATNIYAGTEAGVYFSSNNGANWISTSLGSRYVSSLIALNGVFYAGTDEGIFLSKDNAINWIQKNQGLPAAMQDGPHLAASDNFLFASNASFSSWRRSLSDIINIQQISSIIPTEFSLKQNFPNPFNPVTKINFYLPQKSFTILKIYDLSGKEITNLVNEKLDAGSYEFTFNGEKLASGVYFYRLETESYSETKLMTLIK